MARSYKDLLKKTQGSSMAATDAPKTRAEYLKQKYSETTRPAREAERAAKAREQAKKDSNIIEPTQSQEAARRGRTTPEATAYVFKKEYDNGTGAALAGSFAEGAVNLARTSIKALEPSYRFLFKGDPASELEYNQTQFDMYKNIYDAKADEIKAKYGDQAPNEEANALLKAREDADKAWSALTQSKDDVAAVAAGTYKPRSGIDAALKGTEEDLRAYSDVEDEGWAVKTFASVARSAPQTLLTKVSKWIGAPIMFASAYTNVVEDMEARGIDTKDAKAQIRAFGGAAVETISEYMYNAFKGITSAATALKSAGAVGIKGTAIKGVKGFLDGFLKESAKKATIPTLGRFLAGVAKVGAEEGAEEIFSEIGNSVLALVTVDKGKKFWSATNTTDPETGEDTSGILTGENLFNAFVVGSLSGAVMSFGANAREFVSTRKFITDNKLTDKDIRHMKQEDLDALIENVRADVKASPVLQKQVEEEIGSTLNEAVADEFNGTQFSDPATGSVYSATLDPKANTITLQTEGADPISMTMDEFDARVTAKTLVKQDIDSTAQNPNATQASSQSTAPGSETTPPDGAEAPRASQSVEPGNIVRSDAGVEFATSTGELHPIEQRVAQDAAGAQVNEFSATIQSDSGESLTVSASSNGKKISVSINGSVTEVDANAYAAAANKPLFLYEQIGKPMLDAYGTFGADTYPALQAVSTAAMESVREQAAAETKAKEEAKAKAKPKEKPTETNEDKQAAKEKDLVKQATGKKSSEIPQEVMDKIHRARQIARTIQSRYMSKEDMAALKATDADFDKWGIVGYLNPIKPNLWNRKQQWMADSIKDMTGKRVVFTQSVGSSEADGFVSDFSKDTVFVNTTDRSISDIAWTIGHELFHLMVKDNRGDVFATVAKKHMPDTALDEFLTRYSDTPAYQKHLRDSGTALEEVIADRAGDVFTTPQFWKDLSEAMKPGQRRSLVRKIADFFKKVSTNEGVNTSEITAMVNAFEQYKTDAATETKAETKAEPAPAPKPASKIPPGAENYVATAKMFKPGSAITETLYITKQYKNYFMAIPESATGGHEERFNLQKSGGEYRPSYNQMFWVNPESITARETEPETSYSIKAPDTEAFKKWFGNSKVVDANGDPRVMYHGTTEEFYTFRQGDIGFHFGTKSQARTRAGSMAGARIMEVYIKIENPLVIDTDYGAWDARMVISKFLRDDVFKSAKDVARLKEIYPMSSGTGTEALRVFLESKGYDGIQYQNFHEGSVTAKDQRSYIAFRQNQIKSATANNGEYSPTNPDIRYSIGYRGTHRAPETEEGTSLDNLSVTFPKDVYEPVGLRYYGFHPDGNSAMDRIAWNTIRRAKGNPDMEVEVYRAIPSENIDPEQAIIQAGDWVSLSRAYVEMHGERSLDGKYTVVTKKVRASELNTDGDWLEWGYNPDGNTLEDGESLFDAVGDNEDGGMKYSISRKKLQMADLSEKGKAVASNLRALETIHEQVKGLLKVKYEATMAPEFKNGKPVLVDKGPNKGKQKISGFPGLAGFNVHNINMVLSESEDIRKALLKIQNDSIAAGIMTITPAEKDTPAKGGFVTSDGYLIASPIEAKTLEKPVRGKPKSRKEEAGVKMWAFWRGLPQSYLDELNHAAFEDLRGSLIKLTEKAYAANESGERLGGFVKIFPAAGKTLKEVVDEGMKGVQAALRNAEKTWGALSLNSLCPMFTVGNNGCYLDGCYLTQMANGATGVNLFKTAMYTGEILQLSDKEIENLNSAGGLRINGVGDTTANIRNQWADIIRHAGMRGLNLKIITKQMVTFDHLKAIQNMGISLRHVMVQPSMDNLWTPATLDEYRLQNVRGGMAENNQISDSVNSGRFEAAEVAYDALYGRETKMVDGILYRKYGFTERQIGEMRRSIPGLHILPRYVVANAKEIAELALRGRTSIFTLMHGKVEEGLISDYPGRLINFGAYRHLIYEAADGWTFVGVQNKTKEVKQTPAHKEVEDYIKSHYTPMEQDIIFKNMQRFMCCQDGTTLFACMDYAAHGAVCSNRIVPLEGEWDDVTGQDIVDEAEYDETGYTKLSLGRQNDETHPDILRLQEELKPRLPNRPTPVETNGRIPDVGLFAAVKTDDGKIFWDKNHQYPTHVSMIKAYGIPAERIVSGGWISDGVFDETNRSDTMRFVVMEKAKQQVELNRALAAIEESNDTEEFMAAPKYSIRKAPPPEKTGIAYKALRVRKKSPGKLFPLFVNSEAETPVGVWLDADVGDNAHSKLGKLAKRPGWHLGDLPRATHIGKKDPATKRVAYQHKDVVWAEVEYANDVNWQDEANRNGINKNGIAIAKASDIRDKIPKDGSYRYKTNSNMEGNWIITGAIKIKRILSDSEVDEIQRKHGLAPIPRFGGSINPDEYGIDYNAQYSIRRGLRNDRSSTRIKPEDHGGIQNLYAPFAGFEKTWDHRDFVGKYVESTQELFDVAAIARDSRIEHNHIFYVKDDQIVQHESWTSGNPSSVASFYLNTRGAGVKENSAEENEIVQKQYAAHLKSVRKTAEHFGADGFYISHNHPNGNPEMSPADKNVFAMIRRDLPGLFRGSIVVGQSTALGVWEDSVGSGRWIVEKGRIAPPPYGDKGGTYSALDKLAELKASGVMSAVGRAIAKKEVAPGTFLVAYIDANAAVSGVQAIPNGMLNNPVDFEGFIRNQKTMFSGTTVIAILREQASVKGAVEMYRRKIFEDVLYHPAGKPRTTASAAEGWVEQYPGPKTSNRESITMYSIASNMREHSFWKNFNANNFDQKTLDMIRIAARYYNVQSNEETFEKASAFIRSGPEEARMAALDITRISPELTVVRMMFMYADQMAGKHDLAANWAYVINKAAKTAGQAAQAHAMFKKLSPQGIYYFAVKQMSRYMGEENVARVEKSAADITKGMRDAEMEALRKALSDLQAINDALKQDNSDLKRKLTAAKNLEIRIRQYMTNLGEFKDDPVKDFIEILHGVSTTLVPPQSMPKSQDPVAFVRWFLRNGGKTNEAWDVALRMFNRLHANDALGRAEIMAYFGEFIPGENGAGSPTVYTAEMLKNIGLGLEKAFSDEFYTFQSVVKRLLELGVTERDAITLARYFQSEVANLSREQKIRTLRKILPKTHEPAVRVLIDKIINTTNDHGLTSAEMMGYIANTMGLPSLTPEMAAEIMDLAKKIADINETAAKAGRVLTDTEQRDVDVFSAMILARIAKQRPSTWSEKIDLIQSMAMLSGFKSAGRNIIGNTFFLMTDTVKDYLATVIDVGLSKFTGTRSVPRPELASMLRGAKRGAKESAYDIAHGIDTSSLETGYSIPKGEALKSKGGEFAMKIFRYKMQLPDRIYQGAAYESHLDGLMKLAGVSTPTQDMIDEATDNAAYKTFSDNNPASAFFGSLRSVLNGNFTAKQRVENKHQWGLGSILIKFPRVPGALLMRALEYSPISLMQAVVTLAKPAYEARRYGGTYAQKFTPQQQKKLATQLANGTWGSAITVGLGLLLTGLGLLTGREEDDDKKRSMLQTMGISQYQLNWTGLMRFIGSGFEREAAVMQEGDTLSTYDWMSPMSIGMAVGANLYQETQSIRGADLPAIEKLTQTTMIAAFSGIQSLAEMSVMSGLARFLDSNGYRTSLSNADREQPYIIEQFINAAVSVPASFIPNELKIIRELNDNTRRYTYSTDALKYAGSMMLNKIPGAEKTLPPSTDVFGNLKEVYQANGNNPWNVFFNPTWVSKYTPTHEAMIVLNTMAEKEGTNLESQNVTPSTVKTTIDITLNGVKTQLVLSTAERMELQQIVGQNVKEYFRQIPENATMESKVKAMNDILSDVSAAAKEYMAKKKLGIGE